MTGGRPDAVENTEVAQSRWRAVVELCGGAQRER
jgi:hypothetical protein